MTGRYYNHIRENILYAGSSAIMLAFAHIHAELWFLALVAFVPFLKRLCQINRREAFSLGVILASSYLLATGLNELATHPVLFLLKFTSFNILLGLTSQAIHLVAHTIELTPSLLAASWLPVGYLLVQPVEIGDVLLSAYADSGITTGLTSLSGILLLSTVIVLGNTLILIAARYVKQKLGTREGAVIPDYRRLCYIIEENTLKIRDLWAYQPTLRAPPIS